MEEFNQLWNEVKAQLTDNLPAGASVLLSRVDLRSIENGVALITAQSKFVLDSIKDTSLVTLETKQYIMHCPMLLLLYMQR